MKRNMKHLQYYQFLFCYLLLTIKDHALCVKEITITPAEPHVKLGDAVTLTCETTCEGKPQWKQLDDSDAEITFDGKKSFLKIAAVQLDHQQTYTCTVAKCLTRKKESVKLIVDSLSTEGVDVEVISITKKDTRVTPDPLKTTVKADVLPVHTTENPTEMLPTTTWPATINALKESLSTEGIDVEVSSITKKLPEVASTSFLPTKTRDPQVEDPSKTTIKTDIFPVHTTENLTKMLPTTLLPTTINHLKDSLSTEGIDVEVSSITKKLPEVASTSFLPAKTRDPQVEDPSKTTIKTDIFPVHTTENLTKMLPTTLLPTTINHLKDKGIDVEVSSITKKLPEVASTSFLPTKTRDPQVEDPSKTTIKADIFPVHTTENITKMLPTTLLPTTIKPLKDTAGAASSSTIMAMAVVGSVATLSFLGFLIHLIRRKKRKLSPNDM
ncbi:uncharacterized protein LOC105030684 isoform X4 [Esox lucius]|uniref:uncharacterized protein LOC105030684 isoform X4 n=1 Tax=Esox lucius TaxID=8010 RepID=UPI001476C340|nr:uncharacterized protein LOC105030684 isoform X4 [Esox lucius]